MPSFSQISKERLSECHPDLQAVFNEVVKRHDCSILCGHRSQEAQEEAFNQGLSQVRWPNSKHNVTPSMAVDAGPYFAEIGNTDWNDAQAFARFAGSVDEVAKLFYQQGKISHHIRWGGDWDSDGRTLDESFRDLPHFELIP